MEGFFIWKKVKEKWKDKYPTSLRNWEDNWNAICPFFSYSESLRKIMYITNTIESLNCSFRKYTKTKSVFPNGQSLMKCLYLATQNITKKWNTRYGNGIWFWVKYLSYLMVEFKFFENLILHVII